jgi:carbonic anhydrase
MAAVLIVLMVSIWKVLLQEENKWSGALLFSMLGTAAMGGTIWHGLEDWTLSAAARARPLPVAENFQSGLLTAKSFITTNFSTNTAKFTQPAHPTTWSYKGEAGPEMWGALRDDFKLCASGLNQSPVDIPKHTKFIQGGLRRNWRPEKASLINTGHTLEVNLSGKSKTDIGDNQFELKQIQFHTPSEHQLSGSSYPMEIHFIHTKKDGSQSIVAAFVEIGSENPEFSKISSRASELNESVSVDLGELNAALLLPKSADVFRYQGSITSPPCSEGVVWNVLREPIEFSQEQVSSFRRLFPLNARPLQKLDARMFESTESKIAH